MTEPPIPWPMRVVNRALARFQYPVFSVGVTTLVIMLGLSIGSGAVYPIDVYPYSLNALEITGVLLLLGLIVPYLLVCIMATTRLTNKVFETLKAELGEKFELVGPRYASAKYWNLAFGLCLLFGIFFNVGWSSMSFYPSDPRFWVSFNIVFGQFWLWTLVSVLLYFSIHDSIQLHRYGKIVNVDLYDLNALNGFGRVSSNSFLLIVGASAITTLQYIDQDFNFERYFNTIVVIVPAIVLMVPLPIWSVHRRIREEKLKQLEIIDEQIRNAPREFTDAALQRMNGLMLRREQVQKLRNWPMDLSIFSRFVFYVFIPPLAWIGAALMELYLDGVIGA